jgi:hypothetical protein
MAGGSRTGTLTRSRHRDRSTPLPKDGVEASTRQASRSGADAVERATDREAICSTAAPSALVVT